MSTDVIQIGLGPIGLAIITHLGTRPDLRLVAAVDPDPAKVGRTLGELLEGNPRARSLGKKIASLVVSSDLQSALSQAARRPVVAIHTTQSNLSLVEPQLAGLIKAGLHVVSTTEELSYPWWHHPEEAARIDAAARRAGVALLGTGVNPGYVMDLLPVLLTNLQEHVEGIAVDRLVDAGTRRGPLQRKVGAGISVSEFEERKAAGRIGHVGLVESVALIGAGMGWKLSEIQTTLSPKVAEKDYRTETSQISAGSVLGIDELATGRDADGYERVRLHLQMYVGAENPHDTITLKGTPPLTFTAPEGVPGDVATIATVVNAIPRVIAAAPGLRTSLDISIPRWISP